MTQLSQALEAAVGTRAAKGENPFCSLVAPHVGHFFAVSRNVRAKWSNRCPQAEQLYS